MLAGWLNQDIINVIQGVGAVQGLVLASALLLRPAGRRANLWLGLMVLVLSLDMGVLFLLNTVGVERLPHLVGFTDPFTFLYAPLAFLYTRTMVTGRQTTRRDVVHFLPFLIRLGMVTPLLASGAEFKVESWSSRMTDLQAGGSPVTAAVTLVWSVIYLVGAYLLTLKHASVIRDRFSSIERRDLRWLRFLLAAFLALWAGSVALVLTRYRSGFDEGLIFAGCTVLIYAIGYLGLRQPEIFARPVEPDPAPAEDGGEAKKYEKTRLEDARADDIRDRLLAHLDEARPHLRSGLTLQELAAELDVPPHQLSQVINDRTGGSFYDLINARRVDDVCRRLTDPKYSHLTVLAVALDSGFSSKSTFNAIFKKHKGLTPSKYRSGQAGRV